MNEIRVVKNLKDIELSLSAEDQEFIAKVEKNYGPKQKKEILKELDGSYRKGPASRFGRNYFKKNPHVID